MNYHFNREELVKARDAIRALPSIIRMSVVADLIDYCLHHFGGSDEHGKSYNSALDAVEKAILDKLDYANMQVEVLVENKEFYEAARSSIEADTYRQLLYDVARMRV